MKFIKAFIPFTIAILTSSCSFSMNNSTPEEKLVDPTGITLDYTENVLEVGDTLKLNATVAPKNSNNKVIVWSVYSGKNYLSVTQDGVVSANKIGSGKIRARVENTGLYATCSIQVVEKIIHVTNVSLNTSSSSIEVNKSITLSPTITPSNATNKAVKWSSSNESVATVDNGVVKGLSKGTSTITATTVDGNLKASTTINVITVDVTGISFSSSTSKVELNKSFTLSPTITPSNATNKEVTWSTSDASIATVDNGTVRGLEKGTATITATTVDGGYKASVDITVYTNAVTSISFASSTATVTEGNTLTLSPTITPSNATIKDVTWSTSNSNIATVDNGEVTAKKAGTVKITATTVDGGFQASVDVTVREKGTAAAWTVLLYICGADLESSYANNSYYGGIGLATMDIMEILAVNNKPDDVNIVLETGGASKWTNTNYANYGDYNISSSQLQRHHVENGKLNLDASLSYSSMGSSSTLQSFLEYGLTTYPADKTGLILWNHGGGLNGVCYDEKKSDDSLTASEVVSAVSGALSKTGNAGSKLEFIGYDACLMQVQDIANMNAPYFNYMIASEESEAGEGWDYDNWIDDLYAKKSTTSILKAIVDSFISDNGGTSSSSNDQTLSYLNLSYAEEYRTAWEDMAGQLKNKVNSDNKDDFNDLVESAKHYADYYYTSYGLFDAKDFVKKLASNSTFNPGSSYTNAVLNAHSNFVAYSSAGKGAGNSFGLCMFWKISSSSSSYSSSYGFSNWAYLNSNYGGSSGGGWWW